LAKLLPNCDEVQEVSIIPRGMAAGYTMSRPSDDDNHMTFNKLNDLIAMTMGGRIAEEIIFKDISTGAQNDIKQATELARKMGTEWGMSKELGFVGYDTGAEPFLGRNYQMPAKYSEKTAAMIDEEIRKILDYNYKKAFKILNENKKLMDEMSNLLFLKETIYKDEVDMIMKGESVEKIVEEMDQKEKDRMEKEKKTKEDGFLVKKLRDLDAKFKTAEMLFKA
jgi:cell division protease FtsH